MGKIRFPIAVDSAIESLLQSEDLDYDSKITVNDCGPKVECSSQQLLRHTC